MLLIVKSKVVTVHVKPPSLPMWEWEILLQVNDVIWEHAQEDWD